MVTGINDGFLNAISHTIQAIEKITQTTGSKEDIVSSTPPTNSPLAKLLTTAPSGASESGKGNNINVSA